MTLKTIATCLSAVAFSLVASAVECSVDSLAAVPGTDYEGSTVTAAISGTDAGLDSAKFSAAVLVGGSEVAATVDVTALDTGFTGALTANIPASLAARGSAADAQLVVKYDGETVGGRAFRLVQGKASSVETRGFLDEDGTEEKFGKTATWYVGETEAARTDLVDEDDRIVVDAEADAPVRLVRDEAQRPFPGNAVATIDTQVVVEGTFAELGDPEESQAGLTVIKVEGAPRFAYLTSAGWTTNGEYAVAVGTSYTVRMVIDYIQGTVVFKVKAEGADDFTTLGTGALRAETKPSGFDQVVFVGSTTVDSLTCDTVAEGAVNANLATYEGVEYATVADAVNMSSNDNPIALLYNASFKPTDATAGRGYAFAAGDYQLSIDQSALNAAGLRLSYNATTGLYETTLNLDGFGTAEAPFLIASEADLYTLKTNVENGTVTALGWADHGNFLQTADIRMTAPFGGIGHFRWSGTSFEGTYDGGNHAITDVVFADRANEEGFIPSKTGDRNKWRGFFSWLKNATIRNLTVETSGYEESAATSGLETGTAAIAGVSDGVCTFSNLVARGSITGVHNCGGITVRSTRANRFYDCTSEVNFIVEDGAKTGGIVAYENTTGTAPLLLINCHATGTITMVNPQGNAPSMGTLVGYAQGSILASNCTARADFPSVAGASDCKLDLDGLLFAEVDNDGIAHFRNNAEIVPGSSLTMMIPQSQFAATLSGFTEIGQNFTLNEPLGAFNGTFSSADTPEYSFARTSEGTIATYTLSGDAYIAENQGGKRFTTLQAAFADEGSTTVTLLADVTLDAALEIPAGKTLDPTANFWVTVADGGSFVNSGTLKVYSDVQAGQVLANRWYGNNLLVNAMTIDGVAYAASTTFNWGLADPVERPYLTFITITPPNKGVITATTDVRKEKQITFNVNTSGTLKFAGNVYGGGRAKTLVTSALATTFTDTVTIGADDPEKSGDCGAEFVVNGKLTLTTKKLVNIQPNGTLTLNGALAAASGAKFVLSPGALLSAASQISTTYLACSEATGYHVVETQVADRWNYTVEADGPVIPPEQGTIAMDPSTGYAVVTPADATVTAITITGDIGTRGVVVPGQVDTVTSAGLTVEKVVVKNGGYDVTAACKLAVADDTVTIALDKDAVVDGVKVTPEFGTVDGEETAESPFVIGDESVALGVKTIPGLSYQLLRSTEVAGDYEPVGAKVMATEARLQLEAAKTADPASFYKVEVSK